jgi:hypothetical protein
VTYFMLSELDSNLGWGKGASETEAGAATTSSNGLVSMVTVAHGDRG